MLRANNSIVGSQQGKKNRCKLYFFIYLFLLILSFYSVQLNFSFLFFFSSVCICSPYRTNQLVRRCVPSVRHFSYSIRRDLFDDLRPPGSKLTTQWTVDYITANERNQKRKERTIIITSCLLLCIHYTVIHQRLDGDDMRVVSSIVNSFPRNGRWCDFRVRAGWFSNFHFHRGYIKYIGMREMRRKKGTRKKQVGTSDN